MGGAGAVGEEASVEGGSGGEKAHRSGAAVVGDSVADGSGGEVGLKAKLMVGLVGSV